MSAKCAKRKKLKDFVSYNFMLIDIVFFFVAMQMQIWYTVVYLKHK